MAVWAGFNESAEESIQFATLSAAGNWSASANLSTPGQDFRQVALQPDIAIDSQGNAVAVWEGFGESGGEPRLVVEGASRRAGGEWSAAEDLSPLSEEGFGAPRVALDADGDAAAVWQYEGSDGFFVQSATLPAGGTWSQSRNLTTGGAVYSPQIAVDPQGDGVAVWERFQSGGNMIAEAAAYDATPPQLRDLEIPSTGTVGQPVSFSVSPFDVSSPTILTSWSFGDGAAATGAAVSHVYSQAGTYTVAVTGTEGAGNTIGAGGTIAITIAPAPPANPAGTPGAGGGEAGSGAGQEKGTATAAAIAKVIRGKAQLKLRCGGGGGCSGTAVLTYRPQGDHKSAGGPASRKPVPLGKARFEMPAATTETISVRLSARARKLLGEAGRTGLKARLEGSGIARRAMTLKNRPN
jgi:predicted Rdx family selenoprotein